jgi:hypothetical protein
MLPWLYEIKLKQVKHTAVESRNDGDKVDEEKKPISSVVTFHSDNIVTVPKRGREINKPIGTQKYNLNMVGVSSGRSKTVWKRSTNWYTKRFKSLICI